MLFLCTLLSWPQGTAAQVAESGGVNDSPRERNRVLLKRNPIASEYQAGGEVYRPGANEAADSEGVDFRSLFRNALTADSKPNTRAQLDLSAQSAARKVLPGGRVGLIRTLPFNDRWMAQLGLRHSAADRTIEQYQARWNTIDGVGVPGLPRYAQDRFETRRWDVSAGLRFAPTERFAASYAFTLTDYDDIAYRNRLEPQIVRGLVLEDSLLLNPDGDTLTGVTSEQTPVRRYFHETTIDRRIVRHRLNVSWQLKHDSIVLDAYTGLWQERRLWPGWNFFDLNQSVRFQSAERYLPNLTINDQEALFNLSNASFANFRDSDRRTRDEDLGFRGYWNHRLRLGDFQPWLRIGGLYRSKERVNDQDRLVYESVGEGFSLKQAAQPGERTSIFNGDLVLPAGLELDLARQILLEELGRSVEQVNQSSFFETLQEQYTARETVSAGSIGLYLNSALWQWRLGMRYEHTQTATLGTIIGPPDALEAAGVAPVASLSIRGQTLTDNFSDLDGGRIGDVRRYEQWLPSAAIGWQLGSAWHAQALYYRELMRPQYFDIVNYRRINPTVNRIREGNPELAPTVVTSYGLALRWEPQEESQYVMELYHKDIENFFYDALEDLVIGAELFDVSRVDNGPSARITGYRIAAKQTLSLAGCTTIKLTGDYTYSDTQADVVQPNGELRQTKLPERSRHLLQGNLSLNWQDWSASIRLRYQSLALDNVGDSANTDTYRDSTLTWGATVSRKLPDAWALALRVDNISNTPERSYENSRYRATNNSYNFSFVTLSLAKLF